jgi:hypothetical protein
VRLGLLGPAEGDLARLSRCAAVLLNAGRVDRAVYLGSDDALEEAVAAWATALVGGDPSDAGVWDRAIDVALAGNAEALDLFLRAERARLRLKALERLPREGLRSAELFGDRVVVMIHDKALLDEEDIFSATFLVYGKADAHLVKKIGPRWFITPGKVGATGGGCAVLDDEGEQVAVSFYDEEGNVLETQALPVSRTAKLYVRGGE